MLENSEQNTAVKSACISVLSLLNSEVFILKLPRRLSVKGIGANMLTSPVLTLVLPYSPAAPPSSEKRLGIEELG